MPFNIDVSAHHKSKNKAPRTIPAAYIIIAKRLKFILIYENYFFLVFLSPNLSLCLNLNTTIAPAINSIATAS